MEHYLSLATKAIFVENMALAFSLGMCSFLAVSKKVETAIGLGAAVVFVLGVTCPLNNVMYNFLLKGGRIGVDGCGKFENHESGVSHLFDAHRHHCRGVQIVEMTLDKYAPALYSALGIFLPLIAVNCAILCIAVHGGAGLQLRREHGFRYRKRHRLGARSHRLGCHSRKNAVQQCARPAPWAWDDLHRNRPHGDWLYGLRWYSAVGGHEYGCANVDHCHGRCGLHRGGCQFDGRLDQRTSKAREQWRSDDSHQRR